MTISLKRVVIVEKTNTRFRVSQSALLFILWRHVIVVSAMPFLEEAQPHYVAFVHFYVEKFNFCFGMIKQFKYTISEVSKILVPQDQTYFPSLGK